MKYYLELDMIFSIELFFFQSIPKREKKFGNEQTLSASFFITITENDNFLTVKMAGKKG